MVSWRDLPFPEIWIVDFEYYGPDGERPTPLCVAGYELRSGRVIQQWQGEFSLFPPYRLDPDALFVSYAADAELVCHQQLGWGQPARVLDLLVEFRRHMNDGVAKYDKGFFKLRRALEHFGLETIEADYKQDIIGRILAGPPFTNQDRIDILGMCTGDVFGAARLMVPIAPIILKAGIAHVLHRGSYMWPAARQTWRGVPLDQPALHRIADKWDDIKLDLIRQVDGEFDCYTPDGNFNEKKFAAYLRRNGYQWPVFTDATGRRRLNLRNATIKDMAKRYPQVDKLRELRSTVSKMRINKLTVGRDGRNRASLMPFSSKTSRNQPSTNKFIFGPAKWFRFFIRPGPGRVLIHRDYAQQEVCIAAALSEDLALLAACATGDVYLGIAKQLGLVPDNANADSHPRERDLFKTVVLAIQYGMSAKSLALRTGLSIFEAKELLARLRARYRTFWDYSDRVVNEAGLFMEIKTAFGWTLHTPPETNERSVRNFMMQSHGAEVLRATSIIAERRGIELVAPVHDAIMAEGRAEDVMELSAELDRAMRDGSRAVLRGYELKTDVQIIGAGHSERYYDKRGVEMWGIVNGLVDRLERGEAGNG